MSACLSHFQSDIPLIPSVNSKNHNAVYAVAGITIEWLIKYTAMQNSLPLSELLMFDSNLTEFDPKTLGITLATLSEAVYRFLDGRDANSTEAVYAATALGIVETFNRKRQLPESLREVLANMPTQSSVSTKKTAILWFQDYIYSLGGECFVQDILNMIEIFNYPNGSNSVRVLKFNLHSLENVFVNSIIDAEFDCVANIHGILSIIDIKATVNRIKRRYLYQLLGYALLHDPSHDSFRAKNVGIYHARSGSLRLMPLEDLVTRCLDFQTAAQARKVFASFLQSFS